MFDNVSITTDSVIFVHKPGQYKPPVGDFLGDMTDELNGEHIVEFVSGGPKVGRCKRVQCIVYYFFVPGVRIQDQQQQHCGEDARNNSQRHNCEQAQLQNAEETGVEVPRLW
jgi:hypothetical protein